ncbi:MAG: HAMP domain-containing sensor histidine kinase [Pararobbsia sp.]
MRGFRSSAVNLLLAYLAIFILATAGLSGFVYWRSSQALYVQADSILLWEARYFDGFKGAELPAEIGNRIAHQRKDNFYGLFDANGAPLAGNIAVLPEPLSASGAAQMGNRRLRIAGRSDLPLARVYVARLADGGRLAIARDLGEVMRLRRAILDSLLWGDAVAFVICVLACVALSMRQAKRVGQVVEIAEQISNGELHLRFPDRKNDEIDRLAQVINQMLERIERLMTEVKSTCDNIAHDLRSPLGRARASLARSLATSGPESRQHVEQALAETDDTLARFGALLRISEVEARRRRSGFQRIDLAGLVKQVEEVLEPVLAERGIAFVCDLPAESPIEADGGLLFEAIYNVLDNAAKFTPANGRIEARLANTAAGPALTVRDNGPGIPAHEIALLGRRFYRGVGAANVPGSGLGLSLVSAVLRLHGFSLSISSEAPGACVRIECWQHDARSLAQQHVASVTLPDTQEGRGRVLPAVDG